MGWVRSEDTYLTHPKVLHVGRDARVFWDAARCWSSANLTDGYVPDYAYKVIATNAGVSSPRRLVAILLTHPPQYEHGLAEPAEGGFVIHDYLDYNPSSADIQAKRAARAAAGKLGGQKSGESRRERELRASSGEANGSAAREQSGSPVPIPVPVPNSSPAEPLTQQTEIRRKTSAIARARETALVPLNGSGSPQHAILTAVKLAFGHVGQSEPERRTWRTAASDAVKADPPITPDEVGDLLAEWRRRGWKDPSWPAIVRKVGQLRAPYEPGRRGDDNGRPAAYDALAEAYPELDPRRQTLEAG